ncbi:peptidoglycan-binding protein [Desertifilum sp. FACHB-1129]|uniref:Peptidase C39 domain-containing protein n=2 Tax=Desertifilum TaxID=1185872 RepID=A0A1E5QHJ0_9CYAN|nr:MULTISPECIES: cysteine peptidase family C39 domain-containing protein [Desertifilum]MBD2320077.1 peptidoglycan-binding protein [Desertifilum sp. FACHB-866]MDA0211152.1 cysteine peptidase family C39 domain-containing protein [Cyanobacteria bacterium FC1]MBD2314718.1 peptidoglycan-binding protein [Desertifilum sp. FACHB-1129]MBD2330205.1 peptidoglycan-binding protein [Desertifilum sp. FACHB-868]OEJ74078.1 hypothetical protein BH720_16420 [Desertifilum tharense IPPAS B-1220]
MALEIAISLGLGGLLFYYGMRLGKRLVRFGVTANDLFQGKPLLFIPFLLVYIALIILALNIPQMPIFPIPWRVAGLRVTWTILRVVLLGTCGIGWMVAWKTARRQAIAVILIAMLGFGGFSAAEAYVLAPIYSDLQDNLRPNGIYRQTSNSSCAPAALATLLRYWNIDAPESEVARLAGTSRLGTTMPQLIVAARELGMEGVEMKATWEQVQAVNRPGILGVWLIAGSRKLPHAVTLVAMSDRYALIADPARGRFYNLNRTEFAEIWRQQYVPIFQPSEATLTPQQAANYLQRLGYDAEPQNLKTALRRFQRGIGWRETGELDPETSLLLQGRFLDNVPTLAPRAEVSLAGDPPQQK